MNLSFVIIIFFSINEAHNLTQCLAHLSLLIRLSQSLLLFQLGQQGATHSSDMVNLKVERASVGTQLAPSFVAKKVFLTTVVVLGKTPVTQGSSARFVQTPVWCFLVSTSQTHTHLFSFR